MILNVFKNLINFKLIYELVVICFKYEVNEDKVLSLIKILKVKNFYCIFRLLIVFYILVNIEIVIYRNNFLVFYE